MGSKTFLITGVSGGFGRAFAEEALSAGHVVVGTVRNQSEIPSFEALRPGRAFARVLDITDESADFATVAAIEAELAPIDVLIASAGYGHEGTFEESTMEDLHRQFDVNVFGTVAVIKAVLPGMRERRFGRIFVITSVGGVVASPTLSFYHGSKFAMEGIVTSLAAEVAQFNVHVTAIEPGGFRTEWSGRSMVRAPRTIHDYDSLLDPIRAARAAHNGNQPGDPVLAARALLSLLDAENPPVHLLLGTDALSAVVKTQEARATEMDLWHALSASTDSGA
jgi:NAD(P)-dependent dehydrogenase (short-subunit alcohol dehydrogenase family)